MRAFMKKAAAAIAAVCIIGAGMPVVKVEASDITGHYAEAYMRRLVDKGVMNGYGNNIYKPDEKITRAEFITMVNNVFQYVDRAQDTFYDVQSSDWFLQEMQKAVYAGYISGYGDGTAKPNNPITRQEAATAMWRAFSLPDGNTQALTGFADYSAIQNYARTPVAAFVERGIIVGYPDNTFKPDGNITRAEAASILSRFAGEIYAQANTTQNENGREFNNIIINKPGITLKNAVVTGNLYIAPGIGSGDVTLEGVIVRGDIQVAGGGANSVVFRNTTANNLYVNKLNKELVHLVLEDNTTVNHAYVKTNVKTNTTRLSGGSGKISHLELVGGNVSGLTAVMEGEYPKVTVNTTIPVTVNVLSNGVVSNMYIEKDTNAEITVERGGSIRSIDASARYKLNQTTVDSGTEAKVDTNGDIVVDNKTVTPGSGNVSNVRVENRSGSGDVQVNANVTNASNQTDVTIRLLRANGSVAYTNTQKYGNMSFPYTFNGVVPGTYTASVTVGSNSNASAGFTVSWNDNGAVEAAQHMVKRESFDNLPVYYMNDTDEKTRSVTSIVENALDQMPANWKVSAQVTQNGSQYTVRLYRNSASVSFTLTPSFVQSNTVHVTGISSSSVVNFATGDNYNAQRKAVTVSVVPSNAGDQRVKWTLTGDNANKYQLYAAETGSEKIDGSARNALTVYIGLKDGSTTASGDVVNVVATANDTKYKAAKTIYVSINNSPAVPVTGLDSSSTPAFADGDNKNTARKPVTVSITPGNASNKNIKWSLTGASAGKYQLYTVATGGSPIDSTARSNLTVYLAVRDGYAAKTGDVVGVVATAADTTNNVTKTIPVKIGNTVSVTSLTSTSTPFFHVGATNTTERAPVTVAVAPADATDKTVKWTLTGANANKYELYTVATGGTAIDGSARANLTVYLAVKKGSTAAKADVVNVVATANDTFNNVSRTFAVTVGDKVPVTGLASASNPTFTHGDGAQAARQQVDVTITPGNATDKTIRWTLAGKDANKYGLYLAATGGNPIDGSARGETAVYLGLKSGYTAAEGDTVSVVATANDQTNKISKTVYAVIKESANVPVTNVISDSAPSWTGGDTENAGRKPVTVEIRPANATDQRVKWSLSGKDAGKYELYTGQTGGRPIDGSPRNEKTVYVALKRGSVAGEADVVSVVAVANDSKNNATKEIPIVVQGKPTVAVTGVSSLSQPAFTEGDTQTASRQEVTVKVEPDNAADKQIRWSLSGGDSANYELYVSQNNGAPIDAQPRNELTVYLAVKAGHTVTSQDVVTVVAEANDTTHGAGTTVPVAISGKQVVNVTALSSGSAPIFTEGEDSSVRKPVTLTLEPASATDKTVSWMLTGANSGKYVLYKAQTGAETIGAGPVENHTVYVALKDGQVAALGDQVSLEAEANDQTYGAKVSVPIAVEAVQSIGVVSVSSTSAPGFTAGDNKNDARQAVAVTITPQNATDQQIIWTLSGKDGAKYELHTALQGGVLVDAAPRTEKTVYLTLKKDKVAAVGDQVIVTATANDTTNNGACTITAVIAPVTKAVTAIQVTGTPKFKAGADSTAARQVVQAVILPDDATDQKIKYTLTGKDAGKFELYTLIEDGILIGDSDGRHEKTVYIGVKEGEAVLAGDVANLVVTANNNPAATKTISIAIN